MSTHTQAQPLLLFYRIQSHTFASWHCSHLGGVAHIDAVVHTRILDLAALSQHGHEVRALVAL